MRDGLISRKSFKVNYLDIVECINLTDQISIMVCVNISVKFIIDDGLSFVIKTIAKIKIGLCAKLFNYG